MVVKQAKTAESNGLERSSVSQIAMIKSGMYGVYFFFLEAGGAAFSAALSRASISGSFICQRTP